MLPKLLPIRSSPLCLPCPAISVVIPMYNAENYIEECLESLLNQTFRSFEVVVVDDCSTDFSYVIVESYIPKFDGRLRLAKTKKNSGAGGLPRNLGLSLANGEYVIFLDADDFLLGTALETLYNAAKKYDAEVVYSSTYYNVVEPSKVNIYRDGLGRRMVKEGIEDKTELTIDDTDKIFSEFLATGEGNFRNPWSKFVRRDFLIKNEIVFPNIATGEDCIWCINVYAYAKRFLRLPTPLYFYRRYNGTSITRTTRTPQEQLSYWVSSFVDFLKALNDLQSRTKVLSENPNYCYEAARGGHFEWCLNRTAEARKELSNQEVYEILHRELGKEKDLFKMTVPFFFSVIDNEKKIREDRFQTIKTLRKEVERIKDTPDYPAISVIIPMYNAEKYISDCLESLLAQTFRSFEVIVVDDCSTDLSREIVESYIPIFDGRLTLAKLETNSGSGGIPRNKGAILSRGEYLYFLDGDDSLTLTALEELYYLAKDYDADVICCEKCYQTAEDGTSIAVRKLTKEPLVRIPTFESENMSDRVEYISKGQFWGVPWDKFVRRKLMLENEIFFPNVRPSEDTIWTLGLVFYAKKILRVPNAVNIHRLSENSIMRTEKTPQQYINFWLEPILFGLKSLDTLMGRHEFFQKNLSARYNLLKWFVAPKFNQTLTSAQELTEYEIYQSIKDEFGEKLGDYDVLISMLCTAIYNEKKAFADEKKTHENDIYVSANFASYFTARIDIKLIPKTSGGDFQILSLSDDKAKATKPAFMNKNGIGYKINSYVGKLEFVAKATVGGQIRLILRGNDVRDPNDKAKRIPYWIDYTALVVNGQTILDTLTPTWHNEPYTHFMNVKADEEITFQVEWLPHRSDT